MTQVESDDLIGWLQVTLGNKIKAAKVRFFIYLSSAKNNTMVLFKVTNRLEAHPCVVTVQEMGAARHFIKTTLSNRPDEEKFQFLQTTLEINPKHPIIVKLHKLKGSEADIARLVAEQVSHHHLHFLCFRMMSSFVVVFQLFDNSMIAAGLIDDPRRMLNRINDLLTKTLEKL